MPSEDAGWFPSVCRHCPWHGAQVVMAAQIRGSENMEPVGYLLAMAAELTLKAFLTNQGIDAGPLRHYELTEIS